MQKTVFERMLDQIAAIRQATPAEVRESMQMAMVSALNDPDPAVQAMWDSVPRQGSVPTLEEFMNYLIDKNLLLP